MKKTRKKTNVFLIALLTLAALLSSSLLFMGPSVRVECKVISTDAECKGKNCNSITSISGTKRCCCPKMTTCDPR